MNPDQKINADQNRLIIIFLEVLALSDIEEKYINTLIE